MKRSIDPHKLRMGDLAADGKTYRHMQSLKKLLLELHARKPPAPKGMPRLHAAEIGVFAGATSEYLLREVPDLHLTMVDPWKAAEPGSTYAKSGDRVAKLTQAEMDEVAGIADDRTVGIGHRQLMRTTSVEAAAMAPAWFDLIFLDGEHTYEALSADMKAWWPHLLPGGIFSGHDYGHFKFPGVTRAVEEFSAAEALDVETMPGRVWVIRKPEGCCE